MVWERESSTPSNDDERLTERFTETPRARAARVARKRVDPSTRRAILAALTEDTMSETTTIPSKGADAALTYYGWVFIGHGAYVRGPQTGLHGTITVEPADRSRGRYARIKWRHVTHDSTTGQPVVVEGEGIAELEYHVMTHAKRAGLVR